MLESRIEHLENWRADVVENLDRLKAARARIDQQIANSTKAVEAIDMLVAAEKSTLRSVDLLESIQSDIDDAVDTNEGIDNSEEGKKRKYITRRWLSFVEEHLKSEGAKTVDELLIKAPLDLIQDLREAGPEGTTLFRARRMLRRDNRFNVRRDDGLVSLELADARLDAPKPPAPSTSAKGGEGALVITEILSRTDSTPMTFMAYTAPDGQTISPYSVETITDRISKQNDVWVRVKNEYEPVASYVLGNKRIFSSYKNGEWTSSLARVIKGAAAPVKTSASA